MSISKTLAASLAAGTALFTPAFAAAADRVETKEVAVSVEKLAEGLDHPWAVEVMPDGAYLVTERPGRMRIVKDGKLSDPIAGVPKVSARGQGGLMDVALAPDFATSRRVYFTAAIGNQRGTGTGAFSATLAADGRKLDEREAIFTMARLTGGQHPLWFAHRDRPGWQPLHQRRRSRQSRSLAGLEGQCGRDRTYQSRRQHPCR